MNYIEKIPIPIAGLALSMFALGNLIRDVMPPVRPVLGIAAGIIIAVIILKIIFMPASVKTDLENPVVAGAFATFPMAIAISATYVPKSVSPIVWYVSLVLHISYIIYFISKFCKNFSIQKVFTTWFVTFVGIAACSVSSVAVGTQSIGRVLFYFALVSYVVLLPLVIHRSFVIKNIPVPAQPTLTIFSAPASLLVVGYLNSFEEKNISLFIPLLVLSIAFYILGIYFLLTSFKNGFFPSVSAYTFPLVISAMATKMSFAFLTKLGVSVTFLSVISTIQMYIALLIVIVVFVQYANFIFKTAK